jgi:hypothetical protein
MHRGRVHMRCVMPQSWPHLISASRCSCPRSCVYLGNGVDVGYLATGYVNLALRDVKTESSAASGPLPEELVKILRRHRRDQFGDTQVARTNTLG